MTLALRMGRTLAELDQVLPERELILWEEYDAMSPIGDMRRDMYDAQIAATLMQSKGVRATTDQFLFSWDRTASDTSDSSTEPETDEGGRPALTPAVMKRLGTGRTGRKAN